MNPTILTLFPKVVYVDNFEFNKEKIILEIDKIKFKKPPRDNQSICLQILEEKIFNDLKKPLMNKFYRYAHNILKYTNQKFAISTSWITKTLPGKDSEIHRHRNSMFSGVLYLKTSPREAKIKFWDKQKEGFYLVPSEYNLYNSERYILGFSEKNLIFFPSELQHKVEINNTDINRLSLAFNIIPIGKFGDSDSSMNITLNNN